MLSRSFCYVYMIVGAIYVYFATDLGGLFGVAVSILAAVMSRTIIMFMLSLVNISLSVAFDNFIRVNPTFYFYGRGGGSGSSGEGVDVAYLCLVSTLMFCIVGIIDSNRKGKFERNFLVDFKVPTISVSLFWPLVLTILGIGLFVVAREDFVLSSTYNAYELQKYPMLEYVGLLIVCAIQSSRRMSVIHSKIAYAVAIFFTIVCLLTSYRMVAIVCAFSIFAMYYTGKEVRKRNLVAIWAVAYVGLTYISYWRVGHYDISLQNIMGYYNGRMDNTFTGVIETALIYTEIGRYQEFGQKMGHMIGALLPVPNALIPQDMLYLVSAKERYGFPGGGALAGFFIYFNYLYAVPYILYIWIAYRYAGRSAVASGMYIILFITLLRWWLYGPYVIFKFLGIFLLLMLINFFAMKIDSLAISKVGARTRVRAQSEGGRLGSE